LREAMLYESQDIGPVPCNSPNLVLDIHICLNDPLEPSIETRKGPQSQLLDTELANEMVSSIYTRWAAMIPSIRRKWRLSRYTSLLCFVLSAAVPCLTWYLFAEHLHLSLFQTILLLSIPCALLFTAGCACAWYWLTGIADHFRAEFVQSELVQFADSLQVSSSDSDPLIFTVLYPLIYHFVEAKSSSDSGPTKHIYCVLRVSDGIVFCDDQEKEPIQFTTSKRMREVHSKTKSKPKKASVLARSYTPRSDDDPPILHQMRKNNRFQYSVQAINKGPLLEKYDVLALHEANSDD